MKLYYKLVRDKIPDIIAATGARCTIRMLADKEYIEELDAKLQEELDEYHDSHNVEELADLLEVIYAAAAAQGVSAKELDALRAEKAARRGRFEKRIFLRFVED